MVDTGRAGPVGRAREIAQLVSAYEDAAGGRPTLVLLTGEAGIGKTTVATAVAEHAESAGATVVWGRCWDGGGAPAFWPWIQVVRALGRTAQGRAALGTPVPPILAPLAPSPPTGDPLPGAGDPPPGQRAGREPADEAARFALFEAVARLLERAAADRPLVVVLDDLHAADAASLRLLQFVVRDGAPARLLLLGAYREIEARYGPSGRRRLLADLAPAARQLLLRGLDLPATATLVLRAGGQDGELAERLLASTGGNPLFLRELIALLRAPGDGSSRDRSGPPVPETVREVILRRLDLATGRSGARRGGADPALATAAAIGREFRQETLARATELPAAALLARLEAACSAGLLRRVRPGRYAFDHDLVRETLYQELPPADRARAHAAIAAAIESSPAGEKPGEAAELAHHLMLAGPGADPARAARWARAAGDEAHGRLAFEDAARWYEAAVDGATTDEERCDLLRDAGAAAGLAGRGAAARGLLERSAELARRAGDPDRFGMAVYHLGGLVEWGRVDHRYLALAEEALLGLGEGAVRVRVLGRIATASRFDESRDRRDALSRDGVLLARRLGDPGLLAYALDARLYAMWAPDTFDERATVAGEIIELARLSGDTERGLAGRMWALIAALEAGDAAAALEAVAGVEAAAARLPTPRSRLLATSRRATVAFFLGDLGTGERLAREAHAAGSRAGDPEAFAVFSEQIHLPLADQGRTGELVEVLDRIERAEADREPTWLLRRTLPLLVAVGRVEEARARYERTPEPELMAALRRHAPHRLAAAARFVQAAVDVDSTHCLPALYRLLAPYENRNVVSGGAVTAYGCVARYLGLAAGALGELDRAGAHFEVALGAHTRWDARPWLARTAADHAALLLRRGGGADRERAADLVGRMIPVAEDLGMGRVGAALRRLATRCAAPDATPEPAAGGDVLRREGDVWAVGRGGRVFRVKDSKGMRYLARLLARPGTALHVLELAGAPVPPAGRQPIIDERARTAYRKRLTELSGDLDEAEAHHDTERAGRLRFEIEFLRAELAAALGLGGRDREHPQDAERARVAVTKALRGAVRHIGGYDADLAHYLDLSLRTGRFCQYLPPPGSVLWHPTVTG